MCMLFQRRTNHRKRADASSFDDDALFSGSLYATLSDDQRASLDAMRISISTDDLIAASSAGRADDGFLAAAA